MSGVRPFWAMHLDSRKSSLPVGDATSRVLTGHVPGAGSAPKRAKGHAGRTNPAEPTPRAVDAPTEGLYDEGVRAQLGMGLRWHTEYP